MKKTISYILAATGGISFIAVCNVIALQISNDDTHNYSVSEKLQQTSVVTTIQSATEITTSTNTEPIILFEQSEEPQDNKPSQTQPTDTTVSTPANTSLAHSNTTSMVSTTAATTAATIYSPATSATAKPHTTSKTTAAKTTEYSAKYTDIPLMTLPSSTASGKIGDYFE